MDPISTFDSLSAAKGLKFVHLNVRSLVKKIDQVRTLLADAPLDVLTLSETWLTQYLSTQLFQLDGYKTFRLDRAVTGKNNK